MIIVRGKENRNRGSVLRQHHTEKTRGEQHLQNKTRFKNKCPATVR